MSLLRQGLSENIIINGTRGARCLWLCQHTVNEPFQPEQTYIYWQGQNNSNTVVHVYSRGIEEYQHQSQSFNNRTKIFPDLLSSGNFSLIIEPLMLKDDQTSLEVVFMQGNKEREKPCQLTLYVAGMVLGTYLFMANKKLIKDVVIIIAFHVQ